LSIIGSKDSHLSRRRRRKRYPRAKLKKISQELKPSRLQFDTDKSRKTAIASQATGTLMESVVVDDRLYNPLARWDYFSELETPFVTLEQTILGNSDPIHKAHTPNTGFISELTNDDSKKAIRKSNLRSTIARSELSFVVSLLSSRWSKSALHTRVLSCTSSTGQFCEGLWDMCTCSSSHTRKLGLSGKAVFDAERRFSVLPGWRPCCVMSYAPGDRRWTCSTCGSSATLCRPNDYFRHTKPTLQQYKGVPDMALTSIDLLVQIEADPILSSEHDSTILDTGSATMDFLQSNIQSELSGHLVEELYADLDQVYDLTREQSSELILAQDRFGNTALHHSAALQNFAAVLRMISLGVPVEVINSSGQTFVHLLDASRDIDKYIEILRCTLRASPSFPICYRDNYGLSIVQTFLITIKNVDDIPTEQWSEITSLLGNQSLGDSRGRFYGEDLELDFPTRFASLPPEKWISGDTDLANELDRNGDTCLIALVKKWPENENIETLLRLINHLAKDREPKANVNAFDGDGMTPLAYTAQKGNRAATELLLDLGANPNSRSLGDLLEAKTILQLATERRHEARKKNDQRLYAAILECERSLVLAGAMRKVNLTDEFKLLTPALNPTGR
jgi:ankyrin repeat protein